MADTYSTDGTPEDLQQEIARLQNELAEATNEKLQAAQYGLVVLEEKQQLQQQCEELEGAYEAVKHELDCAKEVSQDAIIHRNFTLFRSHWRLFNRHF